jgi:hypothetical protein
VQGQGWCARATGEEQRALQSNCCALDHQRMDPTDRPPPIRSRATHPPEICCPIPAAAMHDLSRMVTKCIRGELHPGPSEGCHGPYVRNRHERAGQRVDRSTWLPTRLTSLSRNPSPPHLHGSQQGSPSQPLARRRAHRRRGWSGANNQTHRRESRPISVQVTATLRRLPSTDLNRTPAKSG